MPSDSRDWMVRAKCRTSRTAAEFALYVSDNRGGRQAENLERACGGCTTKRECAAYALLDRDNIGGMVWAGVPVPQTPSTRFHRSAVAQLERIADGLRL